MFMHAIHPAGRYLPLLVEGDLPDILSLFEDTPAIDDPRLGHVRGVEACKEFVAASRGWLAERSARVEPVATTHTDERNVHECILHLAQHGEPIPLPVAVVADLGGTGSATAIRVYHSLWPLLGMHWLRAPLLPAVPGLVLPDVIARYQAALARGDLNAILAQFEPEGLAREPSGGPHCYRGAERLRHFYGRLFANGGGIPLQHCSVTDDGVHCAVEYIVTDWGCTTLPPQAGVAVYERGASGLLAAARIYDDVEPPAANA